MMKPGDFRPNTKAFDDIASIAGGAINIVASLRHQIRNEIKSRIDETIDRLDLVPREDLDVLQARLDDMQARLDTLEQAAKPKKAAPKKTAKKTTAKKTGTKKS